MSGAVLVYIVVGFFDCVCVGLFGLRNPVLYRWVEYIFEISFESLWCQ